MYLRLGDILVLRGLLTAEQRDEILEVQRSTSRPFGALAEEMFGIQASEVEHAWATQYASIADHIDPRDAKIESRALNRITRRQAWQFCLLPLHYNGDSLIVCTTRDHIARAMRFTGWRTPEPTQFVIAEPEDLGMALMRYYPMDGASPEMLSTTAA